MRRTILACLTLLAASSAFAANPYFLDRNGVLWSATSDSNGLTLTGQVDNQQVVQSAIPFAVGLGNANDTQMQVVADNLTGKVAVVWQRNWAPQVSEIMLAVWNSGNWERIDHLSQDLTAYPRNPTIKLTRVSVAVPDPDAPDDPLKATSVQDSYVNVVWWEGTDQAHAELALLCLTAQPGDTNTLTEKNLDDFVQFGLTCGEPVPAAVIEHPLFADDGADDRAEVLFGSQHLCLFQLLRVSYTADTQPATTTTGGGMTASTQRRRSVPVFGVMKAFALTQDMSMDGTRVILGANLNPVAYRVVGPAIQYATYSDQGWSPARTLAIANGLTLDQAIPLVENLAR